MRNRIWMPAAALGLPLAVALGLAGCPKPATEGVADGAQAQPATPEGPAPEIACEEPSHDFGTISQGTEAVHTFVVKNKGQGVLKIERAKGG